MDTPHEKDLESNHQSAASLINDEVTSYAWSSLDVRVKDRATKNNIAILTDAHGIVEAGEMLAIMGPSGSGKTTLLNAIAYRVAAAGATTTGTMLVNGEQKSVQTLRRLSTYVEQEDALIGSLTVRETMWFASGLSLASSTSRRDRLQRVDDLIASFGLREQADTIVGTPIKKGLSGGQKKRLGVASRLVTSPKIIFLDEPTSGLDSTLSYEVMKHIKDIAKERNLIVIASIHQPSTTTFQLFDKLCLLAKGQTCYFGPLNEAASYFANAGYNMPSAINPAEFYLDLINTDLGGTESIERQAQITRYWPQTALSMALRGSIDAATKSPRAIDTVHRSRSSEGSTSSNFISVMTVLLHRSWLKAYRDIVAYNIRIIMYLGLAILMGTVFLQFNDNQQYIQPYTNAIFFAGAFMSFMAVAYVPAFLEDLNTYRQESANGLVGPVAFSVANFLIGLPFLFAIVVLFSAVAYFLIGFRHDGNAFFKFVLWLFLDLIAAESLVVLVSVIFPIFVVALAATAFANGLWMCVDGFLVPMGIMNAFWKYVFHYIDYQAYVFQGMMVNEFQDRTYDCAKTNSGYYCAYQSDLSSVGKIRGTAVLSSLKIETGLQGEWIGIMIGIIAGYRILAFIALAMRSR